MGDIEKAVALDHESMRQAEARTVAGILTTVPSSQREQVRAGLVEYFESTRGQRLADLASPRPTGPRVALGESKYQIVTVALVAELPSSTAEAVVIRRPGDDGKPLLLLPASTVTDDELRLALRAAAEIAQKQDAAVSREFRYAIHDLVAGGPLTPRRPGVRSPLEDLRARPLSALAGVGSARSMDLAVPRKARNRTMGSNE